jgi:hypothetical protein
LPDETVNGEPASVYQIHEPEGSDSVDSRLWISKTRHIPLKAIVTTSVGTASGTPVSVGTASMRYEYENVQPPPGVK